MQNNMLFHRWIPLMVCFLLTTSVCAQSAYDTIRSNRLLAACNYYVYPDSNFKEQTPPPTGYKPFYISHYGRHGSRYLNNRYAFDMPYHTLEKADSLNKLTSVGKAVLGQIKYIVRNTENQWGELTELGKEQHRGIARRMMERFPEVFVDSAIIDAKSTMVIRCILSMATAMQEIMTQHPKLNIQMDASKHDMVYLNFQDKKLRDSMMTYATKKAFAKFANKRIKTDRMMKLLFNDSAYIKEYVDSRWFNYYLLKTGLMQQNTSMRDTSKIADLFTDEEIYHFWEYENAWWYFMYGPSLLNGGKQPFTQRMLLQKIIDDADFFIQNEKTGASLRYGHETIVLPLTCLLDLNGYGYQTMNLEDIESHKWWACMIIPMAANIQFVFYRKDKHDKDILLKVLLNENEATLPLPSDDAPYYHWNDFKEYYLKKLDGYNKKRKF